MAATEEQKDVGEVASDVPATGNTTAKEKIKKRGVISRMWNSLFRVQGDDFEKRLQHISKEEAAVLARMKKRSTGWRRMARNLIVFSVLFEVIAVVYAIMTTRSLELNWKMRAVRVLPMFLLPVLSYLTYSSLLSFNRMWNRKDQKTLERLRAERQAKIDELKEKTNYYITQQLIQRYDPDPAAKAAAASVLASKLGADSGLTVYMEDTSSKLSNNSTGSIGKSNDAEFVQSTGLRRRKQQLDPRRSNSSDSAALLDNISDAEMLHYSGGSQEADRNSNHNQHLIVEHHTQTGSTANDGGWIARIAALLVGEDPTQSYALICGNCRMHNGLARKEDFPYITYYCPHCNALNGPKNQKEVHSLSPISQNLSSSSTVDDVTGSGTEKVPTSSSPMAAAGAKREESEGSVSESVVD